MVTKQSMNATEIQAWLVSNLAELLHISAEEIDITQPLDSYGLDSTQAMVIVTKAQKMLGFELSPTLLWHYPTIEALSGRLAEEAEESQQDNIPLTNANSIPNLAAEAILDENIRPVSTSFKFNPNPQNIFLTGGTGFLGAFVIHELLQQTDADIYCLVRATDATSGKEKLKNNLEGYGIWNEQFSPRIIPIVGDLSQPQLGISTEGFEMLATNIDAIYHSAAMLNYVFPYSALKAANVLGTQEILRLACQIKVKPLHYVSSVAVFESPYYAGKVVKEDDNFNHWEGIFLGYSQTKWVAEKLVKIASQRGLPVTIYRPPLISGHSETGVGNTDDFVNLMTKGCLQMGAFPDVDYMLDMSPVDYVSKAIAYLSRLEVSIGKAFHLQHPEPAPLSKLVDWLNTFGFPIKMIPYEEWQHQLNNVTSEENPLYTLRPFLLERWSEKQLTIPDLYLTSNRPIISCDATLNALAGSGVACATIDAELFTIYSVYLIQNGFLNLESMISNS
ncbi:MAG: thioester reductase domain-containing protein [Cyanobacteria bacterium P01_D01_bin.50]